MDQERSRLVGTNGAGEASKGPSHVRPRGTRRLGFDQRQTPIAVVHHEVDLQTLMVAEVVQASFPATIQSVFENLRSNETLEDRTEEG